MMTKNPSVRLRFGIQSLIVSLILSLSISGAQAAVIGTQEALQIERGAAAIEQVHSILSRDDARSALERMGVDPDQALARVAALTPAEAQQLADGLQDLPAGSVGVIEVIGIVALVLFILELTGVTDVFTKI